ncbi:MAG: type II secretion system protein G [Betaproteobacteria bacterium]|nr:type II secretion system protein G [Betaproteobacteria bacterium]
MIIALSIVALLLTVALPRYFGAVDKSKDVVLQENLKVLRATLDKYYADKGRYPEQLEELVEGKYLRAIPIDPVTESAQTWVLIHPDEEKGIVDVKSGARGLTQDGQSYDAL